MRALDFLRQKQIISHDGTFIVTADDAMQAVCIANDDAVNSLRNHYAGLAMQALLEQGVDNNVVRIAREAVEAADALIRELNKD